MGKALEIGKPIEEQEFEVIGLPVKGLARIPPNHVEEDSSAPPKGIVFDLWSKRRMHPEEL